MSGAALSPAVPAAPSTATEDQPFWSCRWGYAQASTVAIMLIGAGATVQARFPSVEVDLPRGWVGWATLFGPLAAIGAARRLFPQHSILAGIGGVPMAVLSVLSMAILSVPGAIWPQGAQAPDWAHRLGFDHVFTSFPMAAAIALVLANLASSTARRLFLWRVAEVRFVLLHAGLMVAIGAALVGGSQLERVRVPLEEGAAESRVGVLDGRRYELPFGIRLRGFRLETFPPTFALASAPEDPKENWRVAPGAELLGPGTVEELGGYRIEVLDYIARAGVVAGIPRPFSQDGAGPAVRVRVGREGVPPMEAWLHAATTFGEELFVQLAPDRVLLLAVPRPRKFESLVTLRSADGTTREAMLEVNAPVSIDGWKLYQLDYDESQGAASRVSVIEAIRDPAYPLVLFGCMMTLLGVLWFFWDAAKSVALRNEDARESGA